MDEPDNKDLAVILQELALANVYVTAYVEVLRETIRDLPRHVRASDAFGKEFDRQVRKRYVRLKRKLTMEAARKVTERMSKECNMKH